jgi:riboflavin kinase/FMN adenylyltransferase
VKVLRDPVGAGDADDADARGSVVTIGAFDGVHLGHRAVLRLVRELADARGLQAALVTFDRHPAEIVRPESAPKLLTTLEHRIELLDAIGLLDVGVVLTFDEARSHESAEDFVQEVLVGLLRARLVVVGADFHFGHKRGGNVPMLERMGADLGFEVLGLGLVAPADDSVPFSSTRVRELLAAGDVEGAATVLGRPHELRGTHADGALTVHPRLCVPAAGRYEGTLTEGEGPVRPVTIAVGEGGGEPGVLAIRAAVDAAGTPAAVRFVRRSG